MCCILLMCRRENTNRTNVFYLGWGWASCWSLRICKKWLSITVSAGTLDVKNKNVTKCQRVNEDWQRTDIGGDMLSCADTTAWNKISVSAGDWDTDAAQVWDYMSLCAASAVTHTQLQAPYLHLTSSHQVNPKLFRQGFIIINCKSGKYCRAAIGFINEW